MEKPDWVLEMELTEEMENDFSIFMEEEDDIPQDRIDKMWDAAPHNRPLEGF